MQKLQVSSSERRNTLNILAVGLTTMLVAISTTAVYSISPFYLREVLHIQLGKIGLIENGTELISQCCRLISGVIGDRMQRSKPMFLLGTICSAIARPFLIFANGIGMVIMSKVFDRLGNGISATPRDAFVAQQSSPTKKGSNLGLIMTFKTIGCTIGPLGLSCVGFFYDALSMKTLLIITAIPGFIAVFICMFGMRERGKEQREDTIDNTARKAFRWSDVMYLPKVYWLFLTIMACFMIARVPESFLLLNLKQTGLPQWFCTGTIGFFNAVSVAVAYPSGLLSDKIGRPRVLLLSFLTLVLSLLFFALNTPLLGVLGVCFWGVQRVTSQILSVACIADIVPPHILGTAIGMLNLFTAVSGGISGGLHGFVAQYRDFSTSYFLATIIALISLVLLYFFNKKFEKFAHTLP